MIDAHVESIIFVGEPFSFDGDFDFGNQKVTKKTYDNIPIIIKNRLKAPPKEVYSLHRKFSGIIHSLSNSQGLTY